MTWGDLLKTVQTLLKNGSIDNHLLEGLWILQERGKMTRSRLMREEPCPVPEGVCQEILQAAEKRSKGYPLAYLLGHQEFAGLSFRVEPGVLIPRPETGVLLSWAVQALKPDASALEIGPGSGCLCVSLKKFRPDLQIRAADISKTALKISAENAENLLGPHHGIQFIESDLFSALGGMAFDAVLSNPPYLSAKDLEKAGRELAFEPAEALCSGETGYEIYQRMAFESGAFLNPGGLMALEIGMGMEEKIKILFESRGFSLVKILPDFQGILRVMVLKKRN